MNLLSNIHDHNPLTKTTSVVGLEFIEGWPHFMDLVSLVGNNAAQVALAQLVSGIRSPMHFADAMHLCTATGSSSFINPTSAPGVEICLCNLLTCLQTSMSKWGLLQGDSRDEWELERIVTCKIFIRPVNYSVQVRMPIFGHSQSDEETIIV